MKREANTPIVPGDLVHDSLSDQRPVIPYVADFALFAYNEPGDMRYISVIVGDVGCRCVIRKMNKFLLGYEMLA